MKWQRILGWWKESSISIWHLIWHSIWQFFWHSFWHFIWQSIWHPTWHSLWYGLFAVASSCSGQMITEVEGSIWYRFGADLVMLGSRFWVCADVKFGPLLTYFFLSWGISRYILSVTAIRWQSPGLVLGKHRCQAIYLARVCGWSGRGISDKCGFGPGGRLPVPAPTCAASGDLHKLDITWPSFPVDWQTYLYVYKCMYIYIFTHVYTSVYIYIIIYSITVIEMNGGTFLFWNEQRHGVSWAKVAVTATYYTNGGQWKPQTVKPCVWPVVPFWGHSMAISSVLQHQVHWHLQLEHACNHAHHTNKFLRTVPSTIFSFSQYFQLRAACHDEICNACRIPSPRRQMGVLRDQNHWTSSNIW